jgi:hypothetical protein
MNSVIRPDSHHPVIGHSVIGPAAPTVAEGKLREEFDDLRADYELLEEKIKAAEDRLFSRINSLETFLLSRVSITTDRLFVLESRWYNRVHDWLCKVFRCQ